MATPTVGQFHFTGRSGMTYTKQVYISDVAAALAQWDNGAGAGANSGDNWMPDEDVVLTDVSFPSGYTVVTSVQLLRNGIPTGDFLSLVPFLSTTANRPALKIPFVAGKKIQAIQR